MVQSGVWRGKFDITLLLTVFEVIGAAEIIFRTCAGNRGEFTIAIHVEFDLAFAPPTAIVDAPGHIGTHIVPLTPHAIQKRMHLLVRKRVTAPELRMEIGFVLSDRCQSIGDLVVHRHLLRVSILKRDSGSLAKRHDPVTIKRATRIHTNGKRAELCVLTPGRTEEIAQRCLN